MSKSSKNEPSGRDNTDDYQPGDDDSGDSSPGGIAPERDQLDRENLDPNNWDEMRTLGHRMVDDVVDYLQNVRSRPAWQPPSEELQEFLSTPAPALPQPAEQVYDEFVQHILPYPMGNIHPRFWAWYMGNGTIFAAFAEMLAATMNPNTGGGNHAAILVEQQVLDWIGAFLELPKECSGLLVSGGSMANLVALAVARHAQATYDVRRDGFQYDEGHTSAAMRVYASTEIHSCNQKALELMGFGSRSLVRIPVDDHYRLRVDLLEQAIQTDLAAGYQPICVIGTSGTVNTGAIDDLSALADLCQRHALWFHVDGAIGAVAVLAADIKPQLAGIERADSVALDLHKWLHIPFEAGCVVIRDGEQHKSTFSLIPEYLAKETAGIASGTNWFNEYGVQLSRQFRALKIWMSIREHGLDKLGRMMSKNVAQAHFLATLVEQEAQLELCAPVGLDIVCYRWVEPGWTDEQLNALNKKILVELQESGIAVPSYTTLGTVYCLRVAISNHRSERSDFELLVRETVRIAREMVVHLSIEK